MEEEEGGVEAGLRVEEEEDSIPSHAPCFVGVGEVGGAAEDKRQK